MKRLLIRLPSINIVKTGMYIESDAFEWQRGVDLDTVIQVLIV